MTGKRPLVSGFCGQPNITQENGYNPHEKCRLDGCGCRCHQPNPPAPVVWGIDPVRVFAGAITVSRDDLELNRPNVIDFAKAELTAAGTAARPWASAPCMSGRHADCPGSRDGRPCVCPHHQEIAGLPVVTDETVPVDTVEIHDGRGEALATLRRKADEITADAVGQAAGRQAGDTTPTQAVEVLEALDLTDDEKRRIIAAHLELRPDRILDTVRAILTERNSR